MSYVFASIHGKANFGQKTLTGASHSWEPAVLQSFFGKAGGEVCMHLQAFWLSKAHKHTHIHIKRRWHNWLGS